MNLRITDGTTTILLSGSDGTYGASYGVSYIPSTGAGGTMTEQVDWILSGTVANIRSAVNVVERLLNDARRRRETQQGARVWLEYRPVATDDYYRSELFDGRVVWSSEPGERMITQATSARVRVAVLVERAPWWEGAEAELQLSTSNASAATGGRTIYNHDDAGTGHDNWVQIASTQVGGVLPAPVRVELTNTVGSAQSYRKLHMATNAYGTPASFTHILEAEDASGGGTPTADANCSGGEYLAISLGTGIDLSLAWTISAAQLGYALGRYFRVLARFQDTTGNATVRMAVYDSAGTTLLYAGETFVFGAADAYGIVKDLGTVPLPPGGYTSSYTAITLVMEITGPLIAELDFLQLTPLDAYRYVELFGAAVANNAAIVDDGLEGITYVRTSSAAAGLASPRGEPLLVFPGKTQRLIFLHETVDSGNPASPIANTMTARVYYRPRRPTV